MVKVVDARLTMPDFESWLARDESDPDRPTAHYERLLWGRNHYAKETHKGHDAQID